MPNDNPESNHPLAADLHHHLNIILLERRLAETIAGIFIVVVLSIVSYFGITRNHAGANIRLAGEDISFDSRSKVAALIESRTENYEIKFVIGDKEVTKTAQEIGISYDSVKTLETIYARYQGTLMSQLMLAYLDVSRGRDFPYQYELDELKFEEFLASFTTEQTTLPANAQTIFENGDFVVHPAKPGYTLFTESLNVALRQAFNKASPTLSAPHQKKDAQISTAEAEAAAGVARGYLAKKVTFSVDGAVYTPSREELGAWVVFEPRELTNPDGEKYITTAATVDRVMVGQYLINTVGSRHNDAYREVNTEVATGEVASLLENGKDVSQEVPFISKNSRPPQPWGKYIEINLSKQWLYAIRNGRIEIQTGISSGAAQWKTPTGIFTINRRLRFRDMVSAFGDPVPRVPHVQYFTNQGHAIHGAYWHNEFGPTWRRGYGRSHGCINMPLPMAARLWDWTGGTGTPVWIHY